MSDVYSYAISFEKKKHIVTIVEEIKKYPAILQG
jgi:hypothetical protein